MSLADLLQDVADTLQPLTEQIDDLNIYPGWWDVPTPPAIDVYPSTPFQTAAGFGPGNNQVFLTVRARVSMADPQSGQGTLLRLLDPTDPASVEVALEQGDWSVEQGGVSGFTVFADDAPVNERLLGCDWKISTFL